MENTPVLHSLLSLLPPTILTFNSSSCRPLFHSELVHLGRKVSVPATLNSQSVDRRNWSHLGMDPVHASNWVVIQKNLHLRPLSFTSSANIRSRRGLGRVECSGVCKFCFGSEDGEVCWLFGCGGGYYRIRWDDDEILLTKINKVVFIFVIHILFLLYLVIYQSQFRMLEFTSLRIGSPQLSLTPRTSYENISRQQSHLLIHCRIVTTEMTTTMTAWVITALLTCSFPLRDGSAASSRMEEYLSSSDLILSPPPYPIIT